MENKRNPIVYRLLYLAIFGADAFFSPFYAQYFVSQGMSAEIGILLALVPFSVFFGDLLFAHFTQTFKSSLRLLRILALLEAVAVGAFSFAHDFGSLVAFTVLTSFFNNALFQIQDGTCTVAMRQAKKGYESVRLYGSIAYTVVLIAGYFLVGELPYSTLFLISAGLFVLGFLLTFLIDPIPEGIPARTPQEDTKEEPSLWKNKNLRWFLVFNTVFYAAANTVGTFLGVYLKQLGLPDNEYSLWFGLRVALEIVGLALFPLLYKKVFKSHKATLAWTSVGFLLSGLIPIFVPDAYAIVSLSFLIRGFSNGVALSAGVLLVHDLVGDRQVTRVLVLSSALCNVATGLSYFLGNVIANTLGFPALFGLASLVSLLGYSILFLIKEELRPVPVPSQVIP